MPADECSQDLHHRRVVSVRVAGDTLQCVDTADSHVELVGTELLDRLGVTVSYLSLLGEFDAAARQREVPGGVNQRPCSEQARAKDKQPTLGGIASRPQRSGPRRPGDRPYVVAGDQVRYRPEDQIDARRHEQRGSNQQAAPAKRPTPWPPPRHHRQDGTPRAILAQGPRSFVARWSGSGNSHGSWPISSQWLAYGATRGD